MRSASASSGTKRKFAGLGSGFGLCSRAHRPKGLDEQFGEGFGKVWGLGTLSSFAPVVLFTCGVARGSFRAHVKDL